MRLSMTDAGYYISMDVFVALYLTNTLKLLDFRVSSTKRQERLSYI